MTEVVVAVPTTQLAKSGSTQTPQKIAKAAKMPDQTSLCEALWFFVKIPARWRGMATAPNCVISQCSEKRSHADVAQQESQQRREPWLKIPHLTVDKLAQGVSSQESRRRRAHLRDNSNLNSELL